MKRAKHSERGASMAETAIVMTCVLLLLFGIIDFARMTYTYSFVANAARMGARWMIVRGSLSCTSGNGIVIDNCGAQAAALQTYVRGLNNGLLSTASITAVPAFLNTGCATTSGGTNGPGCAVQVTVTYPFQFLSGFTKFANINMSSSSTMAISQ